MIRPTLLLVALASAAAAGCADGAKPDEHAESHPATGGASAPAAAPATNPAAHELKKLEKASPNYPLTTCVVSGDKLGEMGDPVAYTYDGTEVQFCCPHCIDDFKKDPEKYLAQVRAAKK
jgi:YHS domain-containing protein